LVVAELVVAQVLGHPEVTQFFLLLHLMAAAAAATHQQGIQDYRVALVAVVYKPEREGPEIPLVQLQVKGVPAGTALDQQHSTNGVVVVVAGQVR
jgi:hypothetical protein